MCGRLPGHRATGCSAARTRASHRRLCNEIPKAEVSERRSKHDANAAFEDAMAPASAALTSRASESAFDQVLAVYVAASTVGVRSDDPAELEADALDAQEQP